MSFRVTTPGFISTVQDYGRFGHAQQGLAQSGVADEHAFCWANHLLDNHFNDAVIEITYGGCEMEALAATDIIVTGADLGFKINGQNQKLWQVIHIEQGDTLNWSGLKSRHGLRSYLAVKGGIRTELMFHSRSVNLREGIGRQLKKGDELHFIAHEAMAERKSLPSTYLPDYQQQLTLRMVASYQYNDFNSEQRSILLNQIYTLAQASDRTGCRLEGEAIAGVPSQMVSEGMTYGSIEITRAGLPIILLKDSPTIGGYPKMGTVFSLDLAKLAQRQPGSRVKFEIMELEEAQKQRKKFNAFFGIY